MCSQGVQTPFQLQFSHKFQSQVGSQSLLQLLKDNREKCKGEDNRGGLVFRGREVEVRERD